MHKSGPAPYRFYGLIDLDGSVDFSEEKVGGIESDGTGYEPEGDGHQGRVGEIQESRHKTLDVQFSAVVEYRVCHH